MPRSTGKSNPDDIGKDNKYCPYCAEVIKAAAVLCRYCKSPLTGQQTPPPEPPPQPQPAPQPQPTPQPQPAPQPATQPCEPTVSVTSTHINVMPISKLLMLGVFSGGIWNWYWFYRNMVYLKYHRGINTLPIFTGAVFALGTSLFFCFPSPIVAGACIAPATVILIQQMRWIKAEAEKQGCPASYSPIWLAICYGLLLAARFMAGNMFNIHDMQGTMVPVGLSALVLDFLIMLPLMPVQRTVNMMSGLSDQLIHERGKFSKANYLWVVCFAISWLSALLFITGLLPYPSFN